MIDKNTERQIIELRAKGLSYASIAKETGVAKQTAVDVVKKCREEIATLQALDVEELHEEQRITYKHRITSLASLMGRVREEIDKRDLSDVPTEKLIDLYLKQLSALKEEVVEPSFKSSEEQGNEQQERIYLERLTATA